MFDDAKVGKNREMRKGKRGFFVGKNECKEALCHEKLLVFNTSVRDEIAFGEGSDRGCLGVKRGLPKVKGDFT